MTPTESTSRIDALRTAVAVDPVLSQWEALTTALAVCGTDEEAEAAFLGAQYFTRLRSRSRETMGMIMEARRRGLPYEVTVTDDPNVRENDRYEVELSMIYPPRKTGRRP